MEMFPSWHQPILELKLFLLHISVLHNNVGRMGAWEKHYEKSAIRGNFKKEPTPVILGCTDGKLINKFNITLL